MPPQIQTKTVSVTNTRLVVATLALIGAAALAFAATTTFNNVDVCEQQDNGVVLYGVHNSEQVVENYCADDDTLVTVLCNTRLGDANRAVVINKTQTCSRGTLGNGGVCSNGEGCVCGPGYILEEGRCQINTNTYPECVDSDAGDRPKTHGNVQILGPDGGPVPLYTIKDYCINDTTLVEGVCRNGVYQAVEVDCGQDFVCNSSQRACVPTT